MQPQTRAVLDAALELPETDRASIALALLETLSPATDELTDDELAVELEERLAECVRDPSATVLWSELRSEVHDRASAARKPQNASTPHSPP